MATDKWTAGELPDDALTQVSGGMATMTEMATHSQMATGTQMATGANGFQEEEAGPAGRFRTGKKRGPAGR